MSKPVAQMNELDCLRAIVLSGLLVNQTVFISYLASLPKSDPHVENQPWNNNGVFTISAG